VYDGGTHCPVALSVRTMVAAQLQAQHAVDCACWSSCLLRGDVTPWLSTDCSGGATPCAKANGGASGPGGFSLHRIM